MRLRLALQGPAGSGKTHTAMTLCRDLSPDGRFAVIDTDKRALEYADRFSFLHTMPEHADPAKLPGLVAEAAAAGVGSLLVDSLSPYWSGSGGALDRVDRAPDKRAGWNQYRPIENAMRAALLTFPGHVVVTMRVKTEHVTEELQNGRKITRRLGLKADQRDTIDYEFSVIGEMDTEHGLTITKTTCARLTDRVIERPAESAELVDILKDWLGQGDPVPDVSALRARAMESDCEPAELRAMWLDAHRRGLLAAPMLDEIGQQTTLGELLSRLGKERTPVQLADALTEAAS